MILGGGEDYWFPPEEEGGHDDHPATDPTEESKGTAGNLVEPPRSSATATSAPATT